MTQQAQDDGNDSEAVALNLITEANQRVPFLAIAARSCDVPLSLGWESVFNTFETESESCRS